MEELLLLLLQQGIHIENISFVPDEASENTLIRVRQLIPYLLEELVGVKNALPPGVFTEKFPTVRYPYSVVRQKSYSNFGLELEAMTRQKLSKLYASKFIGDRGRTDLRSLSPKDKETYSTQFAKSLDDILNYFNRMFPPSKIHQVVAEPEFSHGTVVGHPDLVIYLNPKKVVIFDVKVFSLMNVTKSRLIRAQLAMYVALARSRGLDCEQVGVILPWSRGPAVCLYDLGKWKCTHILDVSEICADKVRKEPAHQIKWTRLLRQFNVGSHVHLSDAMSLIASGQPTTTPFQIFLYGNNPSANQEQKAKKTWEKIPLQVFSRYNGFVHAPYNLNLASEEGYVVSVAKMYLKDAANYGFKGVVFHVGHHSSSEEGIAIMERNLTNILECACPDTPFILETPCGNQNELLSYPEDFGEFILRFPESLLGICIDTCHVFVAGCMPMEYIRRLGDASDRVCLFHFNGSRKKQGCCADGHGHVTRIQNIPDEELIPVLEKANEWGVYCVTE